MGGRCRAGNAYPDAHVASCTQLVGTVAPISHDCGADTSTSCLSPRRRRWPRSRSRCGLGYWPWINANAAAATAWMASTTWETGATSCRWTVSTPEGQDEEEAGWAVGLQHIQYYLASERAMLVLLLPLPFCVTWVLGFSPRLFRSIHSLLVFDR